MTNNKNPALAGASELGADASEHFTTSYTAKLRRTLSLVADCVIAADDAIVRDDDDALRLALNELNANVNSCNLLARAAR